VVVVEFCVADEFVAFVDVVVVVVIQGVSGDSAEVLSHRKHFIGRR